MPAALGGAASCAAASRLGLGARRLHLSGQGAPTRARISSAEIVSALRAAAAAGVRLIEAGEPQADVSDPLAPPRPRATEGLPPRSLPPEAFLPMAFPSEAFLPEARPHESSAPFRVVIRAASFEGDVARAEAATRLCLRRPGAHGAPTVIVPASSDLLGAEGRAYWRALLALRDAGECSALGIVAEPGQDVTGLARLLRPDIVQLPLSLVDPALLLDGTLDALAGSGVEIHLRRVFHQGSLFYAPPPSGASEDAGAFGLGPRLSRLRRMIAEAGSDPLRACLAFAMSRAEASFVVVGVASAPEIRTAVAAAENRAPAIDWAAFLREGARISKAA